MTKTNRTRKPKDEAATDSVRGDNQLDAIPTTSAKPDPSLLGEHEITAIAADAWDAFDDQDPRIRYDSTGQRWWFGVELDPESVLLLKRSTPAGSERNTMISTRDLGREAARSIVLEAVKSLL